MLYEELKDKIVEAGIVGAGGAGFPTHIKMVPHMDYLVINGAECEPLLYVDQELMAHYAQELIETINVLLKVMHIKKAVIGIKKKHQELIHKVTSFIGEETAIEVKALENTYPSGDEITLIYACTNRIIPKGQLPSSEKVIVCNVETLLNIGNVLTKAEPVTHTYITLGGTIKNKMTVKAPVGMQVSELIAYAGGSKIPNYKVLLGGPMMGRMISENEYVTKTTKALILLPENHLISLKKEQVERNAVKRAMSCCSQCRMCTDLCPRNKLGHKVEPHKLMNAFANGLLAHSEVVYTALGCCGCNSCSYFSCHHELQPGELMMQVKKELLKAGIKSNNQEKRNRPILQVDIPSSKLSERIGLKKYDQKAALQEVELLPHKVVISLRQGIGMPSKVCVVIGQEVNVGEKIATISKEQLGSMIHASITGTVTSVSENEIVIERSL